MLSGRKLLAKLLSVLLVVGTLAVDSSQAFKEERHSYRNFKLIRINPENEAALVYLLSLYNDQSPYLLDFWQPPTHVGAVVDLTVAPSDAASLVRDLSARGIHYIVAINDLQKAIESERSMAYAPGHGHMAAAHPIRDEFSYERYNSLADIHGELKRLKKEKPNLITLIDIGQTHENNTLLVIKIGGSREPPEKSSIWLDAGIHAREWIAPSTAMYIIRELVQGYDRDPSLQALLDHTPFYVLPVMNPDGYEFSRTQDRMWRKNRRPADCVQKEWHTVCCRGVDLNRNFDWFWAASGSSSDTCHDTYHGPAAFSEPETVAVKDFLEAYPPKAFLSLHSYSQMWLIPFGHRRRSYPSDYSSALRPLALKATKALEALYGTKYQVGTGADLMYEASGGSHDWAKGALKVPFAYLIELRPRNTLFGNGFLMPEREIVPTGKETWAAIRVVADEVFAHFGQNSIRSSLTRPAYLKPTTPYRQRIIYTTTASRSETTPTALTASTPAPTSTPSTPHVILPQFTSAPPPRFTTLSTVKCVDYGSYCRLWQVLNLCERRAVAKLCSLTCNPFCYV